MVVFVLVSTLELNHHLEIKPDVSRILTFLFLHLKYTKDPEGTIRSNAVHEVSST